MSRPPGWVGSGRLRPAPRKVKDNPCDYCGGTGKDYRSAWDIADVMFPDDCPVCGGSGEAQPES